MKFALVDGNGRFVGPPPVSNRELQQIIADAFEKMQNISMSSVEFTRSLRVLESLMGTTGFLLNGGPCGRLSADQTADLGHRLNELPAEALQRIQIEVPLQDLVVQLRFLTAQAERRNLALWLVTDD